MCALCRKHSIQIIDIKLSKEKIIYPHQKDSAFFFQMICPCYIDPLTGVDVFALNVTAMLY